MNGYIKLSRKMMEWEWWHDDNTLRLWLTILFLANWEDKEWHGEKIPRGSFWTSIESLSKKSGLTPRQVRTALKHLEDSNQVTSKVTDKLTNKVTNKVTNHGRLITVVNYGVYQDLTSESDKQNDKQNASHPTSKATTTEEIKNKYNWGGGFKRETG